MYRPMILSCFLGTILCAGGLSDLQGQLQKQLGVESLRATVELDNQSTDGDGKAAKVTQGHVHAWVESSAQGLKLFWNADLLRQANQEAAAKIRNPEVVTPIHDTLGTLELLRLAGYFTPADRLLRDLQQATLVEERPDSLDGAPARLLVFKLEPRLPEKERRFVKEMEASARVWIDAGGLPLAEELHVKVRGRAFLVINFASEETDRYRFGLVNGHLVTVRHEHEDTGSGGGEKGHNKRVVTLAFS